MADERPGRRGGGRPPLSFPWTPLERSLFPSCAVTAAVLIGLLLLTRLRLPPLPYSLLLIAGLWVLCFIPVYLWQVQRWRRQG